MPSPHLSLHYHLVFSTKHREPWINTGFRTELHEYLGGIVRGLEGIPLAVGGVTDHVHLLVGLRATHRLSDVMRQLKSESSRWVHQNQRMAAFGWQEGYGAFCVGPGDLERVRSYILAQEEHHRTKTFQEEYLAMLDRAGVEYNPAYLW